MIPVEMFLAKTVPIPSQPLSLSQSRFTDAETEASSVGGACLEVTRALGMPPKVLAGWV